MDVSRSTGDVGEGECVLVCRDGGDEWAPEASKGQQMRNQSQILGQGGINKLVVVDDALG